MKPAAPVTSTALSGIVSPVPFSEPPQLNAGRLQITIEFHLDVEDETRAIDQQFLHKRPATIEITGVCDCENDSISGLQRLKIGHFHTILMAGVRRTRQGIMDLDRETK